MKKLLIVCVIAALISSCSTKGEIKTDEQLDSSPLLVGSTFRLHADKTQKAGLVATDIFLIEDADASWATKYTSAANILTYISGTNTFELADTNIIKAAEIDTQAEFEALLFPINSMIYPGAGVANSTGSAWGTSYTVGTAANNLLQLNASSQIPAVSGALLTATFTGTTLSTYTTLVTAVQALGTELDGAAVDLTFEDGFDVTGGAVSFDPTEVAVWDLGASTSFELPNGANPTTDASGEIAVDSSTGAGQGVRAYGAVGFTLPAYITRCTTISAATSASDFFLTRFPFAVTVRRITVTQTGATNVIGGVGECTSAGASCGALDSDITTTTTMATDDGTLTDSAIAADGIINWHTTSVSGTNTEVMICLDVTANQVN